MCSLLQRYKEDKGQCFGLNSGLFLMKISWSCGTLELLDFFETFVGVLMRSDIVLNEELQSDYIFIIYDFEFGLVELSMTVRSSLLHRRVQHLRF
ncbi:hypothetical protein GDO81_005966 [Engystomops pustulosus]|uniref:Coatomer subunit zeta n=1 Tax=Engystomops pustulosus TaxID=76066 RepID=A0AAV7CTE0_ENGPU|nr:hypothetical protein GDO81_005966 [Engystomops pustulosus]